MFQLQHFKEVEVAKIKLEEKEKTRKEVQELRREMERTYEKKWEGLISREQHAIERLQKQREVSLLIGNDNDKCWWLRV